jgi:hypothetical protein
LKSSPDGLRVHCPQRRRAERAVSLLSFACDRLDTVVFATLQPQLAR